MKHLKSYNKFNENIQTNELNKDEIFKHYLIAALWSTSDIDYSNNVEDDDDDEDNENAMLTAHLKKRGENLDAAFDIDDIDNNTKIALFRNVSKFIDDNKEALIESGLANEQIGHTLWLAQNGHGSGFYDYSELSDDIENQLTDYARNKMKEVDLYVGDDQIIYAMGLENENAKFEVVDFDIPTWALPALINSDYSGLNDSEIEKLNKFCDKTALEYGNANFSLGDQSDKHWFKWHNDIDGNLGADVTKLYLIPTKVNEDLFSFISTDYQSGLAPDDEKKLSDFIQKQSTDPITTLNTTEKLVEDEVEELSETKKFKTLKTWNNYKNK